ncbi:MAG: lipopolysaccharide assembly protein LapB [Chromatiaceae bacterium]|nr:lipopolysaccharide assembly protein LapB [Chromatiaceae bacterium]
MIEWLLLLLPVAAASGWWAARRSDARRGSAGSSSDPAFFRGLNYLLDEQPDKAIDVFVKLAEVDGETAETHLALGSLFRRRGEVDRAIRIHQNLVSRPNLSKEQRGYALFELGQDYMRAGLFDRAESMFAELVELKLHRRRALEGLREIYQQEKDWTRCLEVAEQLQSLTGEPVRSETAQYHCELAEEALELGKRERALAHLCRAQKVDSHCVRATMLQAQMAVGQGDSRAAVMHYLRVAEQGPQFLPEILPDLLDAYRRSGREDELAELKRLYRDFPSPALVLLLADAIQAEEGDEAAIAFLVEYLSGYADLTSLERLLALYAPKLADDGRTRATFDAALTVVAHLRAHRPHHQCEHCGFVARRLHWQCPSCKQWESIKPVQPEPIGKHADAATSQRIT